MTKRREFKLVLATWTVFAAICLLSPAARAQGGGEKTYKAKCASCHGADGAGATPAGKATKARDFCSDEVKKETDDEWTTIIVKGKNKMPGYDKKLTDAEIKDLVAYIRSLCKK
jgi:mono/diheme cytochrome c family protein